MLRTLQTVCIFLILSSVAFARPMQCRFVLSAPDRSRIWETPSVSQATAEAMQRFFSPRDFKEFDMQVYESSLQDLQQLGHFRSNSNSIEGRIAFIEYSRRLVMDPVTYRESILDEVLKLRRSQQREFLEIVGRFDLRNPQAENLIGELSSRIYFLLKGIPFRTVDLLFRSQEERFQRQISIQFGEQLLRQGLLRGLSNVLVRELGPIQTLQTRINLVKQWPVWNYLRFPGRLPRFDMQPVPDELIERAIIYGESTVQEEIDQHFRSQGGRRFYNSVARPTWKAAFLAVSLAVLAPQVMQLPTKAEHVAEQMIEQVHQSQIADYNVRMAQIAASTNQIRQLNTELSQGIFIRNLREIRHGNSWNKTEVTQAAVVAYNGVLTRDRIQSAVADYPDVLSMEELRSLVNRLDAFAHH